MLQWLPSILRIRSTFYKIDDKALQNWVLYQPLLSTLCSSTTLIFQHPDIPGLLLSLHRCFFPSLNFWTSLSLSLLLGPVLNSQSLERFLMGGLKAFYACTTIISIMYWTVCHLHWTWSLCHIPCYLTSGGYSVDQWSVNLNISVSIIYFQ